MNEIIPAILPKDAADLKEKVAQLPKEISLIHLDTLEQDIWTDIGLDFEVHLMVSDPRWVINQWIKRRAKRIIVHSLEGINLIIKDTARSVQIGLGLELNVPLEDIFRFIPQVDFLHLMSIAEIGEQGHPLDERIFARIKMVKERFPEISVSVDGGINTSNYQTLIDAGADRLVVGSGFKDLWKSLTKN